MQCYTHSRTLHPDNPSIRGGPRPLKRPEIDASSEGTSKRVFVRSMVRLMNLILLTTKELYPLREIIKKCHDDESRNIFLVLYKTWCCSPVSLVSLCLLAQRYDLGLVLVNQFKRDIRIHKSVQFLLEIDELIHLLESPIFLHLRLQLLCLDETSLSVKSDAVERNKDLNRPRWNQLYEIVNGLLTLLPNSDGFHFFRVRIAMVALDKRLCSKLAHKSKNEALVNDEVLQGGMYHDRCVDSVDEFDKSAVGIKFSDKDKLFEQYLTTNKHMRGL